ncbi:adenosylcobinamide amidohydrolase [Paenibacillus sp. GbtcB18]|uniref:adenosylcobinamide amidohydrolase n=1 Tax=Paenibacillus sp. GbtcB18 TaxID=2824763 RepID=UPI001C2F5A65|nr:adenosylcobinamide amidohydrolase [Paenibacillus sp. GbtcB18]
MNTEEPFIQTVSRPAAGITAAVNEGAAGSYLLLEAPSPLRTLSSAPWGGGFGYHRTIINRKVDKTYACGDPVTEMNGFLEAAGLNSEETACLLTSVHMSGLGQNHLRMDDPAAVKVRADDEAARSLFDTSDSKLDVSSEPYREAQSFFETLDGRPDIRGRGKASLSAAADRDSANSVNGIGTGEAATAAAADTGIAVSAWVTVGYSNMARAGRGLPASALFPGTINIIVAVEGELTDEAMVNAVITATEAKAAALQDLGVALEDGSGATGTTTDAVLIASTQRGRLHRYAGTATYLGHMIGRSVYEAAMQSGMAYKKALALS